MGLWGPNVVSGIKLRFTICKASVLHAMLDLWLCYAISLALMFFIFYIDLLFRLNILSKVTSKIIDTPRFDKLSDIRVNYVTTDYKNEVPYDYLFNSICYDN